MSHHKKKWSLLGFIASLFLDTPILDAPRRRRPRRREEAEKTPAPIVESPPETDPGVRPRRFRTDMDVLTKFYGRMGFATDEDLADKHYRRLIVTVMGICIVLGVFAVWQAKPLYRYYKKQSALSQVDEIARAIEDQDFVRAAHLAAAVYQKAPREPEVLRAASRVALAMHSPEAPFFLEKLVEMGEATFEDRRALTEASLQLGELERAVELSEQLLAERPDDVELLRTVAEVRRAQNDPAGSLQVLDRVVELDPCDSDSLLLAAKLLIAHGGAEGRNRAWKAVWRLAETDPTKIGVEALDLALLGTGYNDDHKMVLIDLLETHPLAEERHRIAALELKVSLDPESREDLIREAVKTRRDWEAVRLVPLYRCLYKFGEFDRIVASLGRGGFKENRKLLLIYLDAMGRQRGWAEARATLVEHQFTLPLSVPDTHIFMALCSRKLGEDESVVEEHLRDALGVATRRAAYSEAFNAGQVAEAAGLFELAEVAYQLAQRSDATSEKSYEGLQRIAIAQGDEVKLQEVTEKYHHRFPKRAPIFEQWLYLNALVGLNVESSLAESLELIEKESYRTAPRVIAGLAYYRIHDYRRAAETIGPCKIDELSDAQKAVYAAIAAATGRLPAALEIARAVDATKLLAAERALLPSSPP